MDQQQESAAAGQETAGQAGQRQPAAEPAAGNQDQGDWTRPLDAGPGEEKDPVADIIPDAPEGFGGTEDAAEGGDGKAEADEPLEIVFPDGCRRVDGASMEEFRAIAREFRIPREKAQKLADIYAAGQKSQMEFFNGEHARLTRRIDQEWRREIAADPEVGGGNYEASRNYAIAAIRRFVPEREQAGFLEFYRNANLANNPRLFKFLVRVGKGTGEAAPAAGGGEGGAPEKSRADIMFDNLPSARK